MTEYFEVCKVSKFMKFLEYRIICIIDVTSFGSEIIIMIYHV